MTKKRNAERKSGAEKVSAVADDNSGARPVAAEPAVAAPLAVVKPAGQEGKPVEPVPHSVPQRVMRRGVLARHALSNWFRRPRLFWRIVGALMGFYLAAYPVFALGWKKSAIYTAFWIVVGLSKAYNELSPAHIKVVQRNYAQRKFDLYRLLQRQMFGSKSADAIQQFQRDALQLIASYARDHRHDLQSEEIFANLLIEDGDDLVVIARDRDHDGRPVGARYPKAKMLAAKTISSGVSQCVGDVRLEMPGTADEKPYRSILVIPVKKEQQILGAVSIDSSVRYHFDSEFQDLVTYLSPYVALLSWTLVQKGFNVPSKRGRSAQGSGGES